MSEGKLLFIGLVATAVGTVLVNIAASLQDSNRPAADAIGYPGLVAFGLGMLSLGWAVIKISRS